MTELELVPSPDRRQLLPARGRLVVVDAHGHAFRAYWALEPMRAPDGLPTNALYGLAGLLRRLVYEEQPDYIAVVFDSVEEVRRTFRSTLYPLYKAHRPERPVELAQQLPILRDVTRACGLATFEHQDFEADDLIATIVAMAEAANVQTTIMSADKDLLALVSDRTLVWDAMRGKRYTHAAVEEKLGVGPGLVADYLALCGDASDNVPGVPGIGPKSASALLRAHGSLDAIYEVLERDPDRISKRDRNKLVEHRERAFLSQSLTRLRGDVPLSVTLDALKRPEVARSYGDALWARLGFLSFLPQDYVPLPVAETDSQEIANVVDEIVAVEVAVAEAVAPIDVDDLHGLMAVLQAVRGARAVGLAFVGGTGETTTHGQRPTRRAEHAYVPPALGLAVPSGASWRINLQAGQRGLPGRVVQGSLFGETHEAAAALTLSDVAAGMASLLADAERVLCVHDAKRLNVLGIAPARAASAQTSEQDDAGLAAAEALAAWMARSA